MSKSKRTVSAALESIDQTSLCWKIFLAFVNESQLQASESELRELCINEFNISKESMPPGLYEHLPTIVVTFMNMWSGWHFKEEFRAGKFQKEHYFQRFKKFMQHKMKTVRSQFPNAVKGVTEKQADGENEDSFYPYAISIACPAAMVNTIAFSNVGEDVIMKQHLGTRWRDLTNPQLVNWPHIEVTFQSEDLYFVRRQATDFMRYLNLLPHDAHKHIPKIVEDIQSFGNQDCFSIDYLEKYIKTYMEALKNIPEIGPEKFMEIQTILAHFLEDIKHININKSMATNTLVLFRLSRALFIRNKKLVKTTDKKEDEERVGYCEIITPKIQLLLVYFKAKQNETAELSFEYTDKIKNPVQRNSINVVPKLSYKCTFCKVKCEGNDAKQQLLQHMKYNHKMEQHVRCTICKKQFEVLSLAACRWKHQCLANVNNY